MRLDVRDADIITEAADVAILLCAGTGGLPDGLGGSFETDDFAADPNQTVVVYPGGDGGPKRVVLVGLGTGALTAESIRQGAATGIREARRFRPGAVTVGLAGVSIGDGLDAVSLGEALAIGLELGAYRFLEHRTGLSDAEQFEIDAVTILTASAIGDGLESGQVIASGVTFARDLVNTPPEFKTPPKLADRAVELGERSSGVTVTVLDETELEAQGFGGVLAVGKASDSPPRFIILEYGAELTDVPTVCLVGKGLTFDSGGLNIKPEDGMLNMKNDMGGSAAVFGTMQVAAELQLPVHLVGLVPSAENMISGRSYRPGDIITTLSGKTIEVLNTDAEGRIILSDGLFYAQRYEPDAIVELSTLTGAVIVALGSFATGVMATDQPLADRILAAAEQSGDRAWQLPMWQDYHDMIKGEVGDLKNLGGRPAGSITAGAFLSAFVGDYPFVHLDIAGTAWLDAPTKPYQSKGGTGAGVRLVVEYLRTLTA